MSLENVRTLEQISSDDISCRLKVAGTHFCSGHGTGHYPRVRLLSPVLGHGTGHYPRVHLLNPVSGLGTGHYPWVRPLILTCGGSDYVPDVTIAVWVKEPITEAHILGESRFLVPTSFSGSQSLVTERDLILCPKWTPVLDTGKTVPIRVEAWVGGWSIP